MRISLYKGSKFLRIGFGKNIIFLNEEILFYIFLKPNK